MTAIIHNALADGILIAAIAMVAGVAIGLLYHFKRSRGK